MLKALISRDNINMQYIDILFDEQTRFEFRYSFLAQIFLGHSEKTTYKMIRRARNVYALCNNLHPLLRCLKNRLLTFIFLPCAQK